MYQLHCPLGHTLEIGPEHFGQRLMCPICQAVVHAWPPKIGEPPLAKFEVQCAQGHILRVKQKYLGKEIRCPSCQQLVSMKPAMLLTSNGQTLGIARPEAFKKKSKATPPSESAPPAKKTKQGSSSAEKKPREKFIATPSSRIPPPPQLTPENDTDDEAPLPPSVVEDDGDEVFDMPPAGTSSPMAVPDDDFEFEVVDTQFNMEIQGLGLDTKKPATVVDEEEPGSSPPPLQAPPPRRKTPPVQKKAAEPAPFPNAPTGLHGLSGSELIKVQHAALDSSEDKPPSSPSALLQFHCPNGHLLEVEAQHRGAQIQCPMCMAIFVLPHA